MRFVQFAPSMTLTFALVCLSGCGGEEEASTAATSAPAESAPGSASMPAAGVGSGMAEESMGGSAEPGMEGDYAGMGEGGDGYPGMGGEGYPGGEGYDESGSGDSMEDMMAAGYGEGYGADGAGYGGGYGGGAPGAANNGRPANVAEWTDEQILTAVAEKDGRVLQAIEAKAAGSATDPNFVPLMEQVLAKAGSGAQPAGAAGFPLPGFPGAAGQPGAAGPAVSPPPTRRQGSPPGGADNDATNQLIRDSRFLDSLEVMVGEALLSYAPQAAQGTRDSAANLQQSVSAPGGAGADYAQQMEQSMQSGAPGAGYEESMQGSEGYPAGYGTEMEGGYPGGGGYPGAGGGYGGQAAAGNLDARKLVETVVRGLVNNNTPQAWKVLDGLVAGSVATSLSTDQNTEIVVQEIFSAAAPNIAKGQSVLATALNKSLDRPAESPGTLHLLARVAKRPADYYLSLGSPAAPAPQTPARPAAGMAMGANAAGSSAMGGYPGMGMEESGFGGPGSGGVPPGYGEEGMAGYGEGGMEGYSGGTGGPAPPQGAGPPPQKEIPVPEAALLPVAQTLWAPSVAAKVAQQLSASGDHPGLLALATTIPATNVRQAVYAALEAQHAQGATRLMGAGLFRQLARDPGILTALKSLPRDRAGAAANGPAPPAAGPQQSWTAATQEAVLSLRDRLKSVADDPSLAFSGALPVRIHRGAPDPERSIRIEIPADVASELGDSAPAPTTLYYASVVVTPRNAREMQDVVDHYEKRVKGLRHEDRAKGLLWYDGVRPLGDGRVQTADVVVEQVRKQAAGGGFGGGYPGSGGMGAEGGAGAESGYGGGGAAAGGQVQYRVEVIVVITDDPTRSAVDTSVTSATP